MEIVRKQLPQHFAENYVRLIAAGETESSALKILDVAWIDYFELCARDEEFRKDIQLAREERADRWVDKIADTLHSEKYYTEVEDPRTGQTIKEERPPTKDELSRDKLRFEKLKTLAQYDNPKKYGSAGGKTNINVDIDLKEFRLLPIEQAREALNNDPFKPKVIPADFKEVP